MNLRYTFVYQFANNGWTEEFYSQEPGFPQNILWFGTLFRNRCLAFRATGTIIQGVRVINVDAVRQGQLFALATVNSAPASGATPDVTQVCALSRCNSLAGQGRPLFVRGLRDDITVRNADGSTQTTGPLGNLLASYYNVFNNSLNSTPTWCVRYLQNARTSGSMPIPVLSVVPAVDYPGQTQLNLGPYAGPDGFTGPPWTPAVLSGVPQHDLPGLRGTVPVTFFGPGTPPASARLVVPYTMPANATVVNPRKMFVRRAVFLYSPINNITFQRLTSRDTGRPFALSRGRGQRRVSRR